MPALDRANLRKGKWTHEEEEFTQSIIDYFNTGLLPLPEGTTLRAYLAEKLKCDPMRITKKFTGSSCLGKRIYHSSSSRSQCADSSLIMAVEDAKRHLAQLESRLWQRLERNRDNKEYMGCLDYGAGVHVHANIISTPAIDALLLQSRDDPSFWNDDNVGASPKWEAGGEEEEEEEEEAMPSHFVVEHQVTEAARRGSEGIEGGRELLHAGPPVRGVSSSSSFSSSSYSSSCSTTSCDSYSTSDLSSDYPEMETYCTSPRYQLLSGTTDSRRNNSFSSFSSSSSSSISSNSHKRRRLHLQSASSTDAEEDEEEEDQMELRGEGQKCAGSLTSEEEEILLPHCRQPEMDVSGEEGEAGEEEEEEKAGGALMYVMRQIRKSGSHQDLVDFVCDVNGKMEGEGERKGEGEVEVLVEY